MAEIEDFDIKLTSHVVIKDVRGDRRIAFEGVVIGFEKITGTNKTRIICDPPFWIEATEVT